jgi:HAD superfamily hydrolase (TIGR01509 family)
MTEHAAVLLDMDGLLLDTEPLWEIAESVTAARLGWSYTEADYRALIGVDLQRTAEYLASRSPRQPGARAARTLLVTALARVTREYGVRLRPGAASLLTGLAAEGVPHALVTSSPRWFTEKVLAATGLSFPVVVCMEDTRRHKPDPAPYQLAAWQLPADPRDCAALEDSPDGAESALAAGCQVYAVPSGAPVDAAGVTVLRSLAELDVTARGLRLKSHLQGAC